MKKFLICLTALLLLASAALSEDLRVPGSYQFSPFLMTVSAPPAYTLQKTYFEGDIAGVDSLAGLRDACVSDSRVYVLTDTALYVLTHDFALEKRIDAYEAAGETRAFEDMTAVSRAADGSVYVASGKTGEILCYDRDMRLARILPRPDIEGFENVLYKPMKIAVDSAGRVYVVAKGMYEGMAELNPNGSFSRFFGVNRVKFSPAQYIWRLFATREQRERQVLWLPTEFTNLSIDSRGFIFATIQDEKGMIVKKLNSKGENILRPAENRHYPVGDANHNEKGAGIPVGPSVFVAVDTNPFGLFVCLDQKRGRVFGYNEDGRLLYILGGLGMREGLFRNPIDVDFVGDRLMILDSLSRSIDLYAPTAYGQALNAAAMHQYRFEYEQARARWEEVLSYNQNLTLAYSGIGRALLRRGEYGQAMVYLKAGMDQPYYSKAFEKVRNMRLKAAFLPAAGALALLVCLKTAFRIAKKRREGEQPCVR